MTSGIAALKMPHPVWVERKTGFVVHVGRRSECESNEGQVSEAVQTLKQPPTPSPVWAKKFSCLDPALPVVASSCGQEP